SPLLTEFERDGGWGASRARRGAVPDRPPGLRDHAGVTVRYRMVHSLIICGFPVPKVRTRLRSCPHCPERSEEHTSELQSRENLVYRLLLATKNRVSLVNLIFFIPIAILHE